MPIGLPKLDDLPSDLHSLDWFGDYPINMPDMSDNLNDDNSYESNFYDIVRQLLNQQGNSYDTQDRTWAYSKEGEQIAHEHNQENMRLSAELDRLLRSTYFQDITKDMLEAGINPAVYFARGGSVPAGQTVNALSSQNPNISMPNTDSNSSLISAFASILSAVASNKNADTAVLRSIISAIGSIAHAGIYKRS